MKCTLGPLPCILLGLSDTVSMYCQYANQPFYYPPVVERHAHHLHACPYSQRGWVAVTVAATCESLSNKMQLN